MADDLDFETVEKLLARPVSTSVDEVTDSQPIPSAPTPPTPPPPKTSPSKHKTHKHRRHRSSSSSHYSPSRRHKNGSSPHRRNSTSRHHRRSRSSHSSRKHRRLGYNDRPPKRHSPSFKRVRSISNSPKPKVISPSPARPANHSLEEKIMDEETRRKKEIEEAHRDDLTVLILNLNLKADERDIYDFFAEHAGRVRDIQCIKDQRSGRAKGVAYIEFFTQESVIKALALSGQLLKGQPIQVQASQAEKNRAAKAAKIQQTEMSDGPMKLFVGGLVDVLSNITADELKQFFLPFGDILSVDIQRDPYTGRSKGFAFIQYKHSSEAKEAMTQLNNYELAGRTIKVGLATEPNKSLSDDTTLQSTLKSHREPTIIDTHDNDRLDDDGGGLLSGPSSKLLLMRKLQREDEFNSMLGGDTLDKSITNLPLNLYQDPVIFQARQNAITAAEQTKANGLLGANYNSPTPPHNNITANIVLHSMFNPQDPAIREDTEFFTELIDEATSECSKYGCVQNIFIQQRIEKLDGTIWVRFASVDQALKASNALHGRYFAGNPIKVEYVNDVQWNAYCQCIY